MNRLLKAFQRLRHRKGFGIHSPFAFSLIADVVGYPGHYYGDDLLRERVGNRRGLKRRRAWLLHRLVARLDPLAVVLPPDSPREMVEAAMIARTDRAPRSSLPAGDLRDVLMAASTDYLCAHSEDVARMLSTPGCTLLVYGDETAIARLTLRARADMPGGWALVDRLTAIYIASPGTPFIEYDVKLT